MHKYDDFVSLFQSYEGSFGQGPGLEAHGNQDFLLCVRLIQLKFL